MALVTCVSLFALRRPRDFTLPASQRGTLHNILKKMKIHSSCEIEDFVETHICKLCVILVMECTP